MLVQIPKGYMDLDLDCKCGCEGRYEHICFASASAKLRSFCPPCFEARFVDPERAKVEDLHRAYHIEMTRINGWRIKAEKSFERGTYRVSEIGGYPYPRRDDEII